MSKISIYTKNNIVSERTLLSIPWHPHVFLCWHRAKASFRVSKCRKSSYRYFFLFIGIDHDSDSRYMNVKRRHRKKRIDSNRIESNRIDAIPIVDTWVYEHTLQIFCSGIDQKQQQQQQQQKQQKHGGCQGIERVQNELDMSTSKLAILRRYQHAISDTTPKTADGMLIPP